MSRPTVDLDQLRALRRLRGAFADLEVLAVLEREGSGEGHPPRLTGHQLALTLDDGERTDDQGQGREQAPRSGGAGLDAGRGTPLAPRRTSCG